MMIAVYIFAGLLIVGGVLAIIRQKLADGPLSRRAGAERKI